MDLTNNFNGEVQKLFDMIERDKKAEPEVPPGFALPKPAPVDPAIMCKICNIGFNYNSALYRHQDAQHIAEFECVHCSKPFKERTEIRKHLQTQHNVTSSFACRDCGCIFNDRNSMVDHLQSACVKLEAMIAKAIPKSNNDEAVTIVKVIEKEMPANNGAANNFESWETYFQHMQNMQTEYANPTMAAVNDYLTQNWANTTLALHPGLQEMARSRAISKRVIEKKYKKPHKFSPKHEAKSSSSEPAPSPTLPSTRNEDNGEELLRQELFQKIIGDRDIAQLRLLAVKLLIDQIAVILCEDEFDDHLKVEKIKNFITALQQIVHR